MSFKNLEERMKAAGGAVKMLRDSQTRSESVSGEVARVHQLA